MSEITRFYGITIKMFFASKMPYSATIHDDGSVEVFGNMNEDEPKSCDAAHIWALYGEKVGVFDLTTLQMTEGDLPQRAQQMVCKWLCTNKESLLRMWESQKVEALPPLE